MTLIWLRWIIKVIWIILFTGGTQFDWSLAASCITVQHCIDECAYCTAQYTTLRPTTTTDIQHICLYLHHINLIPNRASFVGSKSMKEICYKSTWQVSYTCKVCIPLMSFIPTKAEIGEGNSSSDSTQLLNNLLQLHQ